MNLFDNIPHELTYTQAGAEILEDEIIERDYIKYIIYTRL